MILKLIAADGCERLVEVSDKRPPRSYITMLRYPLPPISEFVQEWDALRKVPIRTTQRQYDYYARIGQELYEYREVLI